VWSERGPGEAGTERSAAAAGGGEAGSPPETLLARARRVRCLILDVDGVLTDGSIVTDGHGRETKTFNVRDGHGIKLLQWHGVEVAIISGRRSPATAARAAELGIALVYQGTLDKVQAFEALLATRGLAAEETAFLGDDLVDVPVLRRVGLAVAVADAAAELAPYVHHVTSAPGGRGAAREVAELLLKAQERWADTRRRYLGEP
jgi:3-deoxy-D-manno-octulosonate 8-phosphate phosphatase (KDO 8-P phosphatase)